MGVKAKVALVSFDSLGDGLIYLMIAENLRINEYDITYYGDLAYQMREWLPQLNIKPYGKHELLDAELAQYDFVIMSPPSFIRTQIDDEKLKEIQKKWTLVCQKARQAWHYDQQESLINKVSEQVFDNLKNLIMCGGSIRSKNALGLNVVDMTLLYMKERMHLSRLTKNVALHPPVNLQCRRYSHRLVISPDSAGPRRKTGVRTCFSDFVMNWLQEGMSRILL